MRSDGWASGGVENHSAAGHRRSSGKASIRRGESTLREASVLDILGDICIGHMFCMDAHPCDASTHIGNFFHTV